MDRYLDAQLKKLNTNRIDYYLLHGLNGVLWDSLKSLNALDFLDKAKKDGRIVNAGFSFHGVSDVFQNIVDSYNWEFCQIQYNYLDTENQAGTKGLEYAASKGVGVIVMEPFAGRRSRQAISSFCCGCRMGYRWTKKISGGMGVALGLEPP